MVGSRAARVAIIAPSQPRGYMKRISGIRATPLIDAGIAVALLSEAQISAHTREVAASSPAVLIAP